MAARKRMSKKERSDKTRAALVAAARALFARRGFSETGTEAVVAAAGVSRGALYHHFSDKTALFLAVFEDVERDFMGRVAAGIAGEDDPLLLMHRGCEAFLDICCEPEMRRIALIDAPSVLGWQTWREIDAKYGLGLIRGVLDSMADAGRIERQLVEDLSHLILGALSEAAMVLGHSADDNEARARVERTLHWMIDRILSEA